MARHRVAAEQGGLRRSSSAAELLARAEHQGLGEPLSTAPDEAPIDEDAGTYSHSESRSSSSSSSSDGDESGSGSGSVSEGEASSSGSNTLSEPSETDLLSDGSVSGTGGKAFNIRNGAAPGEGAVLSRHRRLLRKVPLGQQPSTQLVKETIEASTGTCVLGPRDTCRLRTERRPGVEQRASVGVQNPARGTTDAGEVDGCSHRGPAAPKPAVLSPATGTFCVEGCGSAVSSAAAGPSAVAALGAHVAVLGVQAEPAGAAGSSGVAQELGSSRGLTAARIRAQYPELFL